jgi:predicted small lipoprotein YifL
MKISLPPSDHNSSAFVGSQWNNKCLIACLAGLFLSGCGLKDDLILPERSNSSQVTSAVEPSE